jgi:hypothetical protein
MFDLAFLPLISTEHNWASREGCAMTIVKMARSLVVTVSPWHLGLELAMRGWR